MARPSLSISLVFLFLPSLLSQRQSSQFDNFFVDQDARQPPPLRDTPLRSESVRPTRGRRPAAPLPPPVREDPAPGVSSECPAANGLFADAYQCDRYYECIDNVISDKLCADGLAFDDKYPKGRCEFVHAVDCTGREKLQDPIPSDNCPRQNGYFAHPNEKRCSDFYFCADGFANSLVCPGGLIFDPKKGSCQWPEESNRPGCLANDLHEFKCPTTNGSKDAANLGHYHPRYLDPSDCQSFYVCIDGKHPRKNGCSLGEVFNDLTGICDDPKNVPDCIDWYKDDPRLLTTTTTAAPVFRRVPTGTRGRTRGRRQ